jgi:flotillin
MAQLRAEEVTQQEINKTKVEIEAEATAERTRREAKGQADAILMKYQAEAEGLQRLLESKATGYQRLIESCQGDSQAASTLLMIEKLSEIVGAQVEAISRLKIDKITVWDSGAANGAGVELPAYFGKMTKEPAGDGPSAPPKPE